MRSAIRLALVISVCGLSSWSVAQEDPKQALKDHNLKQVGDMLVHVDESKVAKMLGELPKFKKQLLDAGKARAQAEQNIVLKDARIQQLRQQRLTLNSQLQNISDALQYNQVVGTINAMQDEIARLSDDKKLQEAVDAARSKVNEVRESYVQHVLDLRKLYDELTAEYESMKEDESIKELIETLSEKKPVRFGPSRTFVQNDDRIKNVEALILSETIALRKEGGVWMTPVVVNGNKPQEFVVDTGAGLLSIPGPLAEDLDLVPGSNSPTIRLSVADGRTIEAKLVIAKSVRVGQFTVENVECAVMPDTASNAPPLLGQSFLSKFTFQLDGDAGKLEMTRIEGEDGAPKAGRSNPRPKNDQPPKPKDDANEKE